MTTLRVALLGVLYALVLPPQLRASCDDDDEWTPTSHDLRWSEGELFVLLPPTNDRVRWREGAWEVLPAASWSTGSYARFAGESPGRVLSLRPRDVVAEGCVANDIDLRLERRHGARPPRLIRVPAGYVDGLRVSPSGRWAALEMAEWWLDGDVDGEHNYFLIVDVAARRVLGQVSGADLGWVADDSVLVVDATEQTAQWIALGGSGPDVLASRTAPPGSRLEIVQTSSGSVLFAPREAGPGLVLQPVREPNGPEWRSIPSRLHQRPTTIHIESGLALYLADPRTRAVLRSVATAAIAGRIVGDGDRILAASFEPSGGHLAVISYSNIDMPESDEEDFSEETEETARLNAWPSNNAVDVFALPCAGAPPSHWGHDTGYECRPEPRPSASAH